MRPKIEEKKAPRFPSLHIKDQSAVKIDMRLLKNNLRKFELMSKNTMKKLIFIKEIENFLKKNFWKNSFEIKNTSHLVKEVTLQFEDKIHSNYFDNYPLIMVKTGRIALTSAKRKFTIRTKILFLAEKSVKRNCSITKKMGSPMKKRTSFLSRDIVSRLKTYSPRPQKNQKNLKRKEISGNYDVIDLNQGDILNTQILKKYAISLRADQENTTFFVFDLKHFKEEISQIDTEKEKKVILGRIFIHDSLQNFDYLNTDFTVVHRQRNHVLKHCNAGLDGKVYIIQKGCVKVTKKIKMEEIQKKIICSKNGETEFFEDNQSYLNFRKSFKKLKSTLEKKIEILYLCKGEMIGVEEVRHLGKEFRYEFEYKVETEDCTLFQLDAEKSKSVYPNSFEAVAKIQEERKKSWRKFFNSAIRKWLKQLIRVHDQFNEETDPEKDQEEEEYQKRFKIGQEMKEIYKNEIKRFDGKPPEPILNTKKVTLKDLSLVSWEIKKNKHVNYNKEMAKNRYGKTANFLKKILGDIDSNKNSKKKKIKVKKYFYKRGINNGNFVVTGVDLSNNSYSSRNRDRSVEAYLRSEERSPMVVKSVKKFGQKSTTRTKHSTSLRQVSTPDGKTKKKFHFLPKFGLERDSKKKQDKAFYSTSRSQMKMNYTRQSNLDLLASSRSHFHKSYRGDFLTKKGKGTYPRRANILNFESGATPRSKKW